MRQIIAELQRIRRRSRAMLLAQRLAVMTAYALGLALALTGLDFLLRLPGTVRLVLLLAAGAAVAYAIWTYLRPAFRFRPGLAELALRAEATFPEVAGRLASSVEFVASGVDKTNALAARSVLETRNRLAGESLAGVLSHARTWRSAGLMLASIAVVTMVAITTPSGARTGLARLFLPYGATQWPARTGVESLMRQVLVLSNVHPRGQALSLRAGVTKGDPDHVDAHYRLQANGRLGPWQHIVLTDQGGGVHERLVDTTAEAIELYFETSDARTQLERITLAPPPAVRRATLAVSPPPYAATWHRPLETDLGPGLDQRAVTDTPSLIGSDVKLELHLNKPIPRPRDDDELIEALGWDVGEPPTFTVDEASPDRWVISWRLAATRSLSLHLVDEYGLTSAEPIAYRIDAIEDRPPDVTVMEPESDEPVLASAVVSVSAEARDDVALATIGIEAGLQRGDRQPTAEQPLWETHRWARTPTATIAAELDLASFELAVGDIVLLRGVGEDVFELDGQRHPLVRSPARRLRIISELDLTARLRRQLGVVRQNAIRIEALQRELQDDVIQDGVQPGVERAQAQAAARIATQRQAVDRIVQRIGLNRLDDEQLGRLVRQAGDLLDFAGRAVNRAIEAIEARQAERRTNTRAPGGSSGRIPPSVRETGRDDQPRDVVRPPASGPSDGLDLREPSPQDRLVVRAQQEVRDELIDLITLLDRDEDTWLAARRLEDLMDAQTKLEVETAALGRQTIGRMLDELTADQRTQLSRIAERQGDLSEQSRQMIEDLHQQAEDLKDVDPHGAAAMRAAATTGEQGELVREMDRAADRLKQNQMRTAQGAQQAARRTLQRMLLDIRESKRASAEELLRRLASLIESIEQLITVQESELTALARAVEAGSFSGRDRAMIRLNQNTQAVAVLARAASQETRRIARVLDRAADAQGAAVVVLRTEPPDAREVELAENRSLDLLREAMDLAEQLEQVIEQREMRRQRADVMAAYREYVDREVALRAETLELAGDGELDRRRLIEARRLSGAQEEIRLGLNELRATRHELNESLVFSHVHALLDDWARLVIDDLVKGEVGAEVTRRQQRIVASIGRLIEALEEVLVPPSEFAQQQGGGSGGGQPRLIPPLAELRLLRDMQEEVYTLTRAIDGRTDLEPTQRSRRLRDLGRSQRELRSLGRQVLDMLKGPPNGADSSPGARPQ